MLFHVEKGILDPLTLRERTDKSNERLIAGSLRLMSQTSMSQNGHNHENKTHV